MGGWHISSFGDCSSPAGAKGSAPSPSHSGARTGDSGGRVGTPSFTNHSSGSATSEPQQATSGSYWGMKQELSAAQKKAEAEAEARKKAEAKAAQQKAEAEAADHKRREAEAAAARAAAQAAADRVAAQAAVDRAAGHAAAARAAATVRSPIHAGMPPYWHRSQQDATSNSPVGVFATRFMKPIVQKVLRASSAHHSNHFSPCSRMAKAVVISVARIENPQLWNNFQHCKQNIMDAHKKHHTGIPALSPPVPSELHELDPMEMLDRNANEQYLFHGTPKENADKIVNQGFDERVANKGLYGRGIYFAHEACKCMQYTENDHATIVISRVVMGEPFYPRQQQTTLRRPPEKDPSTHSLYDSVIANPGVANLGTQVHREYVVYDRSQAYPEFVVTVEL